MYSSDVSTLSGVQTPRQLKALHELGVCTIADMSAFTPSRNAAFLLALAERDELTAAPLVCYLRDEALPVSGDVGELPTHALQALSRNHAKILQQVFEVTTLAEIANWLPFREAQRRIGEASIPEFSERPSAPAELLPELIGSTHTTVRLSNYVKEAEREFLEHELLFRSDPDEPVPASELLEAFYRTNLRFNLGYLALIRQRWINSGTYLGEILHSLALAPGESRNIAFIDWFQRQTSRRGEDTEVGETLVSEFVQTRALNEVVRTTAQEHLVGGTEIDATTKTSGFGLTAGLGSGGSHANAAGGSLAADLTSLVGLPLGASGTAGSGNILSSAGALGGSYVHSSGTVQGVIQSETSGSRDVLGELVQNISDATVQNSSNVRSVMSTVVVEDVQRGGQRSQTRNVTNYNHSHALTIHYYEILQQYLINTGATRLTPVLYLPFRPLDFTITLIQDYWDLLRRAVRTTAPGRFAEWDQAIKDFSPTNEAFDPDGELGIDRIKITAVVDYAGSIEVELPDANPEVKFKFPMSNLDDTLDLEMVGGATYVDYKVLKTTEFNETKFGSVSSIPVDESIECRIRSDFRGRFRSELKKKIDESKKKTDFDRGFNELGAGHNRKNLKDDVDDGNYNLLNGSDTVTIDLDIEYTVIDEHGNSQIVTQQHSVTYTYSQLHSEVDAAIFNASDVITTNLATIADINPLDVIEDIEAHLRFHKYGYTKYLFSALEKEQLIDVMDHLRIQSGAASMPLTQFIDPNPLGVVENLLIFKLKQPANTGSVTPPEVVFGYNASLQSGDTTFTTVRGDGSSRQIIRGGKTAQFYSMTGHRATGLALDVGSEFALSFEVDPSPDPSGQYSVSGHYTMAEVHGHQVTTVQRDFTGHSDSLDVATMTLHVAAPAFDRPDTMQELDIVVERDLRPIPELGVDEVINGYWGQIAELEVAMRTNVRKEFVYLPTSGVFGEAILGRSNASEYVNPRRFYNWQDSPIPNAAPQILAVDLNQDRGGEVAEGLEPTVPDSVVNQIAPIQYPLPTSLTEALQAVRDGSMFTDMSKASELASVLGNLSELANNTAQLAGMLSGQAAADALDAVVSLGQQVAELTGNAMSSNVAPPPLTPTQKAGALNELDSISQNPAPEQDISTIDDAKGDVIGAPLEPCDSHNGGNGGGGGTGGNGNGGGGNGGDGDDGNGDDGDGGTQPSDTIEGTLTVISGLPDPYDYARANILEVIDQAIPEDVDDDLKDLYETLKDLITSVEVSDETKQAAVATILTKVKGLTPQSVLIGLLVDVLLSETTISLIEDLLVLVYDLMYYSLFPHVGFETADELGNWMKAAFAIRKKRGEPPAVNRVTDYPYSKTTYYFAGRPIVTAPNPPSWGVEALDGALRIWSEEKPASDFVWVLLDYPDKLLINIETSQSVMVDLSSILTNAIEKAKVQLSEFMAARSEVSKEEFGEAIKNVLGDGWATDLVEYVIGGVLDLQELVVALGAEVLTFVLFPPSVVVGEIRLTSELSLAVELWYETSYPEGWKLDVSGQRSQFPELRVEFTNDVASTGVIAGAAHPNGFYSLLLPNETIQVETAAIPTASVPASP